MTDIIYMDCSRGTGTGTALWTQAVRCDALARCYRMQGDTARLMILSATADDAIMHDAWRDLHAIDATGMAIGSTCPLPLEPGRTVQNSDSWLRRYVQLSGDLEWWGHGPPAAATPEAESRARRVLWRIQDHLYGLGGIQRPLWRLVIPVSDWPAWRTVLHEQGRFGWLPPIAIHAMPEFAADDDETCCPRCAAISAGLPSQQRHRLCGLPERLRAQNAPEPDPLWRPAPPAGFLKKLEQFDTANALALLDAHWNDLETWLSYRRRQRLSDQEWEALQVTAERRLEALRCWLELLLPMPVARLPGPALQRTPQDISVRAADTR